MNLTLAWRNIWRNKKRTSVVVAAIAIGIWAIIFTVSFSNGIYVSMINGSILHQYSHIQIHHPEFNKDKEIRFTMDSIENVMNVISEIPGISSATSRVKAQGMISTTKGARGIQIVGVDPQTEAEVTRLKEMVIEGDYFATGRKNPVLIGETLAEKLKLKLRSKVVLTFQDIEGNITAGAFRVSGIFRSVNSTFDEANLFVMKEDLTSLLELRSGAHEVAIFLNTPERVDGIRDRLSEHFPDLLVESWRTLAPELNLIESSSNLNLIIISLIIMAALIFGIINTMLMAVLERIRELGMLMAIGLNKTRVFLMIVYETIMLSMIGGPLGLLLGYATVALTSKKGIDLSFYSDSLRKYGMSEMIRPLMDQHEYMQLAVMVVLTAVLASIYPAWKAIRLNPVEALRKL